MENIWVVIFKLCYLLHGMATTERAAVFHHPGWNHWFTL